MKPQKLISKKKTTNINISRPNKYQFVHNYRLSFKLWNLFGIKRRKMGVDLNFSFLIK